MNGIITLFIFILSFIGIVFIIYRKIPVLVNYAPFDSKNGGMFVKIKEKIKEKVALNTMNSGELFLLKILSKLRVVVLKTEHQIGCWLSALRQKSIEKEKCFKESYWEKIKVAKKRSKKPKEKKEEDNIESEL